MSFDCSFGKFSVFFPLFVVERTRQLRFQLRGQFGGDFALDPSQDEWGNLSAKKLDRVFGILEQVSFQVLAPTEQTGHEKPENGPQVQGRVFDWGSGKSKPVIVPAPERIVEESPRLTV